MAHCTVPEAEEILDKKIPVLDKGFVRLVDYMGGDKRIVQSARVSYGKGTKSYSEDKGLIHYLLRNGHTSPFEQVVLTFHAKLPIFVARQWVRHRTARLNEISGRYSVLSPEFYIPEAEDVALQTSSNKQGRETQPVDKDLAQKVQQEFTEGQTYAYRQYQNMLDTGIAREISRMNLPLSLYTEWYWQIDLHNLFHFLKLRMHPHAQREIRAYADIIHTIVRKVCPIATEAFREHILEAKSFSNKERKAIQAMISGKETELTDKEQKRLINKLESV